MRNTKLKHQSNIKKMKGGSQNNKKTSSKLANFITGLKSGTDDLFKKVRNGSKKFTNQISSKITGSVSNGKKQLNSLEKSIANRIEGKKSDSDKKSRNTSLTSNKTVNANKKVNANKSVKGNKNGNANKNVKGNKNGNLNKSAKGNKNGNANKRVK